MKFKVGDEVRAIAINGSLATTFDVNKGDVLKIKHFDHSTKRFIYAENGYKNGFFAPDGIELVSRKSSSENQRITTLEKEVDELKVIVHQLRESNITIEDVKRHFNIGNTSFATYEGQDLESEYAEQVKREKTPNQLRAEIIEKAKGFVDSKFIEGNMGVGKVVYGRCGHNSVEFVVNPDKRTVVALLRLAYVPGDGVVLRGFAKCNPSDVFNEDIGKAIALGRALGLDVSEFEQAVQPTNYVQGHEISFYSLDNILQTKTITKVDGNKLYFGGMYVTSDRHKTYAKADKPKIINDTNAIYGGVLSKWQLFTN